MRNTLIVLTFLVLLGAVIKAIEGDEKTFTPSTSSEQLNNDPECVLVRQKLAASQNGMGISADDLILAQRCNQ